MESLSTIRGRKLFETRGKPVFVLYPVLAKDYGGEGAVIMAQFHYWSHTNKLRGENYYDGKYWVNKTAEELCEEFFFCSISTIRRIIKRLKDDGLLISGNYNRSKFDRSLWYTPNYEKLGEIFHNPYIGNDYCLAPKGTAKKKKDFVPYQDYIKSSDWKKQSKRRMAIDDFKCQRCGTAKNLVVHHITYDRLGNEKMEDLITLCRKCHEEIHKNDFGE